MNDMILLHGAIGSSAQLKPLQQQLEKKRKVHCLDLPGHGGNGMPDRFSISFFSAYVKEFCRKQGLESVDIFGYSMGGYVALYLAKQEPSLVNSIITLASKFHWDEATAAREIKMLQPETIEQKLPKFAETLAGRHAPSDWKKVLNKTASMLLEMGENNPLQPADYADISTPCLILLGDRDKMVTMEETLVVYKQLPNAQLGILPSTPHPIEAVDAELLSFMLERFLKSREL